jgi:Raf kinase inhibitor-like YbhB/YbcL family protein
MHANRTGSGLIAGLTALVMLTAPLAATVVGAAPPARFRLVGTDAALVKQVPEKYTANAFGCTGGNTSPELKWSNPPAGTQSFVVVLFDPDEHSTPSGWWHWVVYDLPKDTTQLAIGAGAENSKLLPAGTLQGRTDLGNLAYHGPCPAKGDAPHHYTFTIYALSVPKLDVQPGASGAMVVSTAADHLLGKAVFVAHYGR